MKKLLTLIMVCVCCSIYSTMAQTDSLTVDTPKAEVKPQATLVEVDSLTVAQIKAIYDKVDRLVPRYKIYQTENINILLKLDTATGKVWMVQYGTGDNYGMVVPVDDTSLLYSWEDIEAGRFELYPTKNMYNFILIDCKYGYTYQVQWHTKESSRMRVSIY